MSKSNMNMKLVAGLLVASGSTAAVASMNHLNVQSHLGERFNGTIVVTGPTAQEILKSPSSVKVSGAAVSARVSKQGQNAVIHLQSQAPINSPVLSLNVQAGTESRQYSAIIDPKNPVHQSAQVNASKGVPSTPTTAANNKQVTSPAVNQTATAGEADKKAPVRATEKPKPKAEKRAAPDSRQRNATPAIAAVSSKSFTTAEQYTVQPNDSIYEIASRYQPQGLSTAQTAKALMRANPQAFRNKNPNLLYSDVTLNIPSAQDMHLLATGKTPKSVSSATPETTTPAAAATAAAVTSTAQTPENAAEIQKKLAQLEAEKAQLEKQLAKIEQQKLEQQAKPADAKPVTPTIAEKPTAVSEPVVASAPAAQEASGLQAASAAQSVSEAIVASETIAQASTPAASAPVAKPPQKPRPVPPPETPAEKGLLDLLMEYLPYIGAGVLGLGLLALLIKKAQQKKKGGPDDDNDGGDGIDVSDDNDVEFDLDDALVDKNDVGNDKLSAAEIAALQSLDTFNIDNDEALRQATAQPTSAPKSSAFASPTNAAAAGVAAATVGAVAASDNFDDFMPSAEELNQFAQPVATSAPELDDFDLNDLNLDSLDLNDLDLSDTASSDTKVASNTSDDFDFDELDNLLQENGFSENTPAPIHNFSANAITQQSTNTASAIDESLSFDLDEALSSNTDETSAATFSLDAIGNQLDDSSDALDDFNFDELANSFDLDTPATTSSESQADAVSLDKSQVALGLAAAGGIAAAGMLSQSQQDDGLTLSQDDIDNINFDDFDLGLNTAEPQAIEETKTNAAQAPVFDLNAFTHEASLNKAASEETASTSDLDEAFAFDLNGLDTMQASSTPSQNDSNVNVLDIGQTAETGDQAEEFSSKFLNISMQSNQNELVFDDSFSSGLNFDDLLKTDDIPNEPPSIESAAAQLFEPDLGSFDSTVQPTTAPEAVVHDFKDFGIDLPAQTEKSTQAWAGTGNFGLDTDKEETNFAFDDLDLANLNPEPEIKPALNKFDSVIEANKETLFDLNLTEETASPDAMNLNLDGMIVPQTADDLSNTTTAPDANSFDLSFDLASMDFAATENQEAVDSIDELDLSSLTANTQTQDQTLGFDESAIDLDFASLQNLPSEPAAAPNAAIDSLATASDLAPDFDLSLDSFDLDVASNNTVAADHVNADVLMDLNSSNLLDGGSNDIEPHIQPAPTATPDIVNDFDFNLDELSASLSTDANDVLDTNIQTVSAEDFDLGFAAGIDLDLEAQANNHLDEALGVAVTQAPLTIDDLDFDFDAPVQSFDDDSFDAESFLEDVSIDNGAEEFSAMGVGSLNLDSDIVLPTAEPVREAPLAMIETAPPVQDEDVYLSSMDHTYSTKWDLAQMYLDLGDADNGREILIDLVENASEVYAQRAQALLNTL